MLFICRILGGNCTVIGGCLYLILSAHSLPVGAENRALIMGIADYGQQDDLPGVSQDVGLARAMAHTLGIAEANIETQTDQQLTLQGMRQSFERLIADTGEDDRVFLYYSGHGGRATADLPAPPHCAEALITQDRRALFDRELAGLLDRLGQRAEKLVVFLDACFSGGATTRGLGGPLPDLLPKYATIETQDACKTAVNLAYSHNGFRPGTRSLGTNYVYIAASRPEEVSYETSKGGMATLAWHDCLTAPGRDSDHSGVMTATELRDCAQPRLDQRLSATLRHHITLTGNGRMALDFAATPPPATTTPPRAAPAETLRDLYDNRDARRSVRLSANRSAFRIGQDRLALTIDSARAGRVYLLMVGSDGQSFTVLFPNQRDPDNAIEAGKPLHLPRSGWDLVPQGPAGQDSLLVVVTDTTRDFAVVPAVEAGPFAVIDANLDTAAAVQGRLRQRPYGAALLTVEEIP